MHFCPGTITTHAVSINSDLQRGWTDVYDTRNIEHRTEPVSHKYQRTTNTTATLMVKY